MASNVVNMIARPSVASVAKSVAFDAESSVNSNASLGLSAVGSRGSMYAAETSQQLLFSQRIAQPDSLLSQAGSVAPLSSLLDFRMDQLRMDDPAAAVATDYGTVNHHTCFATDADCYALWTATCVADDAVIPGRPLNGNVKMI